MAGNLRAGSEVARRVPKFDFAVFLFNDTVSQAS